MPTLWGMSTGAPVAVAIVCAGATAAAGPRAREIRRGLAGTLFLALAAASLQVMREGRGGGAASSTALAVSAAIAILGLGLVAVPVVAGLRRPDAPAALRYGTLGCLLLAGVMSLPMLRPLSAGPPRVAAVLTGIGLLALGYLLHRQATRRPPLAQVAAPPAGEPARAGRGQAILLAVRLVHGAGVVTLLTVSGLHFFFAALLATIGTGVWLVRPARRVGWDLSVIVGLLATLSGWYLLARVAGDPHPSLAALPGAPFSAAFQVTAGALLALAAWSLVPLWPFRAPAPGTLAPFAGAALFLRVIGPGLPDGLAHWQPVLYLLAFVSAGLALWRRREEDGVRALAGLGLASGDPLATVAGMGVLAVGLVWRVVNGLGPTALRLGPPGRLIARALLVPAALASVPLLEGALRAQVVYTAVTVGILIVHLTAD
jgi:hypothetical protein